MSVCSLANYAHVYVLGTKYIFTECRDVSNKRYVYVCPAKRYVNTVVSVYAGLLGRVRKRHVCSFANYIICKHSLQSR